MTFIIFIQSIKILTRKPRHTLASKNQPFMPQEKDSSLPSKQIHLILIIGVHTLITTIPRNPNTNQSTKIATADLIQKKTTS